MPKNRYPHLMPWFSRYVYLRQTKLRWFNSSNKSDSVDFLNYLKIPLLFTIITIVFFWQFFVKGLIPIPGDLVVGAYYPWLNQKWGYDVGVPVKNPNDPDIVSQFYPWKRIVIDSLQSGQLPLWDRTYYLGVTQIGNIQTAIFNPFNLLFWVFDDFNFVWGLLVVIKPLISLFTMYLLLREWKVSKNSAILGSIAYSFSGAVITWVEYNTHGFIFATFPLIIYFIYKGLTKNHRFILGIPPTIAFMVFSGYPQLVYYVAGFSILYATFLLFKTGQNLKQKALEFVKIILSIFLGFGLASIQIIPSLDILADSIRDLDKVASVWSVDKLPIANLITTLIPDFFGNPSTYNFWGLGTYATFAFYTSVVVLTLSLFTLKSFKKNINISFLWTSAFLIILLSLRTPLTSWMHEISFLGLKGASAARGLFIYGFCISALGALGFDQLKSVTRKRLFLSFIVPGIIFATTASLFFLKQGSVFDRNHLTIAFRNSLWPLLIVSSSTLAILLLRKNKNLLFISLLLLLFIDVYRFGNKFLPYTKSELVFPTTPVIDFLNSQKKPFRVVIEKTAMFPPNTWSPYGIENVSGYDVLVPKQTSDFISYLNYGEPGLEYARYTDIKNFDSPLLNISDTKYAIVLEKEDGSIPKLDTLRYKRVFTEGRVQVWENTQNIGRYSTFDSYKLVSEKDVYQTLLDPDINIRSDLILTEDPKIERLGNCEITSTSYLQNSETLTVGCSDNTLLFFSEPYNKDWRAYVNEKETKIYTADARFMAIVVPPGKNDIKLSYFPKSLKTGAEATVLSTIIYLLFFSSLPTKIIKHKDIH